jgi:hypothetical protein
VAVDGPRGQRTAKWEGAEGRGIVLRLRRGPGAASVGAVDASRTPLTSLVAAAPLAAATTGLVAAELARACVCAYVDERRALARGAVALVGRVVSKSPVPRTPGLGLPGHRYVVRVTGAKGARLGREVAVVGETSSLCGFEWRVGDRVGTFLGRIRGVWTTGGCGLVSPVELERGVPTGAADGFTVISLAVVWCGQRGTSTASSSDELEPQRNTTCSSAAWRASGSCSGRAPVACS